MFQLYIMPVTVKVLCSIFSSPETLLHSHARYLELIVPQFNICNGVLYQKETM